MRAQDVYSRLKADITHFRFPPGERLIEEELSQLYEVSRTPIRDALRRLEDEGLVVSRGKRGRFVPQFDVDAFVDLYILRIELERLAVRLACERATDEEIDKLAHEWEGDFAGKPVTPDGRYVVANEHFHRGLGELSHNIHLRDALMRLLDKSRIITVVDFTDAARIKQTREEHSAILEAIRKRDADVAHELAAEHIKASLKNIRRTVARALERVYLGGSQNRMEVDTT